MNFRRGGEFERRFVEITLSKVVGDPLDEKTEVGPLASEQQVKDVAGLVEDAVSKGAKVLCGGERFDRPGFYYQPTVISAVTSEMRVHTEEVFGPVATLYRVDSVEEAIELANLTEFGLGANVWTEGRTERSSWVGMSYRP